jgi:2'-5' RNA ligase
MSSSNVITATPRPSPNLFIALQISNPETNVTAKTPNVEHVYCHVSLQTMNVDKDKIAEVVDAVKGVALARAEKKLNLSFSGIKNSKVIFELNIENEKEIQVLHAAIQKELEARNVVNDTRSFRPHLTLLKMRRDETYEFNKDLYQDMADLTFGNQVCTKIQILSMARKNTDYYHTSFGEVEFANSADVIESTNHLECYKPNTRPNLFIALQISNPEIHAKVALVQTNVTAKTPNVNQVYCPASFSHVTLQVMKVDKDKISSVVDAVKVVALARAGKTINLSFSGIGDFNSKVIFAKLENDEEIQVLHAALQKELEARNLVTETRSFKPHLTLLKTRRGSADEFNKDLYQDMADLTFGNQVCTKIQILSMERKKTDHYYTSLGEVEFANSADVIESTNHSECCKPITPPSRPNLFIALQISNPEIHAKVALVQTNITAKTPYVKQVYCPVSFSHVALQVMKVDKDKIAEVVDAVKVVALARAGKTINLSFSGIGDFNSKVIFAKLENDKEIQLLHAALQKELEARNLISETRSFKPHLTLLKTKLSSTDEFNKDLYQDMADFKFGNQVCTKIQILSRKKGFQLSKKNDSYFFGYYNSLGEVEFANSADVIESTNHSECCAFIPGFYRDTVKCPHCKCFIFEFEP